MITGLMALIVIGSACWLVLPCWMFPYAVLFKMKRWRLVSRRLWVVYDTNSYRELSPARFTKLHKCELRRGIDALASYWVATELLSHMAKSTDKAFRSSWAALRRLWRHCAPDGRNIQWLADSEAHVCHTLFGIDIPGRKAEAAVYGLLVGSIANAASAADWKHLQPALDGLAAHVEQIEQQFRDDVWNYVIVSVNPNATSWAPSAATSALRAQLAAVFSSNQGRDLSAQMFVRKAAADAQLTLTPQEVAEKAQEVRRAFPIPVEYYNAVLLKIVQSGLDLDDKTNRNAIWDVQIAFSASPAASLQGAPVWVVTTDGLLLEAAKSADAGSVARGLKDFERLVTGPRRELNAALYG